MAITSLLLNITGIKGKNISLILYMDWYKAYLPKQPNSKVIINKLVIQNENIKMLGLKVPPSFDKIDCIIFSTLNQLNK